VRQRADFVILSLALVSMIFTGVSSAPPAFATDDGVLDVTLVESNGIQEAFVTEDGDIITDAFPGCTTEHTFTIFVKHGSIYELFWVDCETGNSHSQIIDTTSDDGDGDGVIDSIDNCPTISNPDQANLDGDAFGDACDDDRDGDGVLNGDDACPDIAGTGEDGCAPDTGDKKKSCAALDKASENGKGEKKGLPKAKSNNDC